MPEKVAEFNSEVIVLGLGVMGAAAALALARRGRRVVGLEQFAIGHDRGSSHGRTRVIRKAYYEHADYVPLLRRAYEMWYDLEQRSGRHLFTECGVLSIGRAEGEVVPGVIRAAQEHNLAVEHLGAGDLRRRFPMFRFGDEYTAVLERHAGFLHVEDSLRTLAQEARRLGADLRENEPALAWEVNGNGVVVTTARGRHRAEQLVLTAGPWAGHWLGHLDWPLVVLRKVVLWTIPKEPSLFTRHRFPIYLAEVQEASGPPAVYYGFPLLGPPGQKVARHDGGDVVVDPAHVNRSLAPGEEADCRGFLREHLPQADGPIAQAIVCLYTVTPDRHFILDLHPDHANVALAAGFSGHGFKFAPVVGEIMADLLDTGRTSLPTGLFHLRRFQSPGVT